MSRQLSCLLETFAPELVAVDMPVADSAVLGYREADRATTRAFSKFGCPVHSPTLRRPGDWGKYCVKLMQAKGYHCKTNKIQTPKAFAEVYPHTAYLKILRSGYRIPYKIGRMGKYWPKKNTLERKRILLQWWRKIQKTLFTELGIVGEELAFDENMSGVALKAVEDKLDALACAWAAIEILSGSFIPYGDQQAVIWNPPAKELDLFTGNP